MKIVTSLLLVIGALWIAAALGCARSKMNPDFPLTLDEAERALDEMREAPVMPRRPILVAGGINDPGVIAAGLTSDLRNLLHEDAEITRVSFFTTWQFDSCRDRLIDAVEETWPSDQPDETIEVDVVAYSMGGLVARYAAMPNECRSGDDGEARPRLRIARLFTIASPHRGARMANLPTFDSRALDMRQGSEFLQSLDEHLDKKPYELLPYVRLDDAIVGEENAAPPGREPWWVPNPPFGLSHLGAASDARILADIARRLRGEEPWAGEQSHEDDPD